MLLLALYATRYQTYLRYQITTIIAAKISNKRPAGTATNTGLNESEPSEPSETSVLAFPPTSSLKRKKIQY